MAPISIHSPASRTYASSVRSFRSISCDGVASRMFIIGPRLWPPAITLAPPPRLASCSSASSIEAGRKYENAAGFTFGSIPHQALAGLLVEEVQAVEVDAKLRVVAYLVLHFLAEAEEQPHAFDFHFIELIGADGQHGNDAALQALRRGARRHLEDVFGADT